MPTIVPVAEEAARARLNEVFEEITLAVSATNNCDYCVNIHTARLKELGMTEKQLVELMMVVDLVDGYNRFVQGLQADPELKPFGPEGLVQKGPSARAGKSG